MGVLSDVMSLFRTAPTSNPAGLPPGMSPGQTIVIQQAPAAPTKTAEELAAEAAAKEPLAQFRDLFTPPRIDPKSPAQVDPLKFNTDPGKIAAAVASQDFTKSLDPNLVKKIQDGGEGAVAAMMTAMNQIAQNAATFGLQASTGITEKAGQHLRQVVNGDINSGVRAQLAADAMSQNNPLANNPATAPLFEMVQQRIAQQNPNASPAELAQLASDYTKQVTETLNAHPGYQATGNQGQPGRKPAAPAEPDFSSFLQ